MEMTRLPLPLGPTGDSAFFYKAFLPEEELAPSSTTANIGD
jgi:hypothetical protein